MTMNQERQLELQREICIVRKPVKHARIRISARPDENIQVTIPFSYSTGDVQRLLLAKKAWINRSLSALSARTRHIALAQDQLLFLGQVYTFRHTPCLGNKTRVVEPLGIIKSGCDLLTTEQREAWYRSEARPIFTSKLDTVAHLSGLHYNRFFLRSQRTKWGTCSLKKNISLNYRLVKAPEMVIDYMVAHELAHTRVLNHSAEFWQLVDTLFPKRLEAEQWLDTYGINL